MDVKLVYFAYLYGGHCFFICIAGCPILLGKCSIKTNYLEIVFGPKPNNSKKPHHWDERVEFMDHKGGAYKIVST